MNYARLIAALPLPTLQQTAAFAEHVANNHSWYKHLPFFPPGATFTFFLAPHAGEAVEGIGDQFTTRPLDASRTLRHHSGLATAKYRERFGHWDYWVSFNPRYTGPREEPYLYGVGPTGRERLPDEFERSWSCKLTAFLRFGPMLRSEAFEHEREAFAEYARLHPTTPDVDTYCELARAVGSGQSRPDQALNAFWAKESLGQQQLVLQTLLTVRAACEQMLAVGA
jgi:hypothetical protein